MLCFLKIIMGLDSPIVTGYFPSISAIGSYYFATPKKEGFFENIFFIHYF
jgi:hypothetical protein